ncbi:MAG: hypothetical protein ACPGSD_07710 [Flavobacteriales bacterium]
MFKLSCNIEITGNKKWSFGAVKNLEIVEDVSVLTDTCEIEIPKNIIWKGDEDFTDGKPPIKRGDKIDVWLGYDDQLKKRFTGYIRSISQQTPIVIKCEDSMFLLKQTKLTPKAFKDAKLSDLISYLLQGTGISFKLIDNEIKLGNYRITKPTIAQELQELKEHYLLSSYFRTLDEKDYLYIGLTYPFDNRKHVKFEHGKNIITEDFEYRAAEDIRARVQAQSFDAKNKKTTIEIGDKDGDLIEIRIDGLTESELAKYAKQALLRYKTSGLKGSFKTFGEPSVRKCDIVDIITSDGNTGSYLIKKNTINFGTDGFRQDIEIGTPLETNDG